MSIQNDAKSNSLATAFHEAGHVLIHEIFDLPYIDVSIEVGKESVNYSYSDPQPDSPLAEKIIYACICCAGAIAEDKFSFSSDALKENLGASFYLQGGLTNGSDYQKYKSLSLEKPSIDEIMDFVVDLVIENWKIIQKIAQTLNEIKNIDSESIKQLLDEEDFMRNKERYVQQLNDMQ